MGKKDISIATNIDYIVLQLLDLKKYYFHNIDKIYTKFPRRQIQCTNPISIRCKKQDWNAIYTNNKPYYLKGGRSDEPFPVGVKEHLISTS